MLELLQNIIWLYNIYYFNYKTDISVINTI